MYIHIHILIVNHNNGQRVCLPMSHSIILYDNNRFLFFFILTIHFVMYEKKIITISSLFWGRQMYRHHSFPSLKDCHVGIDSRHLQIDS